MHQMAVIIGHYIIYYIYIYMEKTFNSSYKSALCLAFNVLLLSVD